MQHFRYQLTISICSIGIGGVGGIVLTLTRCGSGCRLTDDGYQHQPVTSVTRWHHFVHHNDAYTSCLTEQYHLDTIPAMLKKTAATKRCVVCNKKVAQRESWHLSKSRMAKPAFCVIPCFERFHRDIDILVMNSMTVCNMLFCLPADAADAKLTA